MNSKYIEDLMKNGYNCSQTVLLYFAGETGISEETAKLIAQPFESGMFKGDLCGALSGAYMVLGLHFGDGTKNTRSLLKEKTLEFRNRFEEKNGSSVCEELLGINITDEENLKKAFEEKIPTVCPKAIITAVEILEEMIK